MNSIMPSEIEIGGNTPDVPIQGYISVRSKGSKSVLESEEMPGSSKPFHARKRDLKEAIKNAESMGFEIIAQSRLGLAVSGRPGAFEELTGGKVTNKERLLYAEHGQQRYVTHFDITGEKQPDSCGEGRIKSPTTKIEGVLIEHPMLAQQIFPTPLPPMINRFHLRVPDDVAVALGAAECHRSGYTGAGVEVVMVDSGHSFHPFFVLHHYDVQPAETVVWGTNERKDPQGHGTSQSANLFAIELSRVLRPRR